MTILTTLSEHDLILGPNCHRLEAFNEKLLPMVIKSARMRAYGAKGSKRLKEDDK